MLLLVTAQNVIVLISMVHSIDSSCCNAALLAEKKETTHGFVPLGRSIEDVMDKYSE